MRTLEDQEIRLMELLRHFWGKRYFILKWLCVGVVTGIILSFGIPKEYKTVVKMVPENITSTLVGKSMDMVAMMSLTGNDIKIDGINILTYPDIIKATPFVLELSEISVQSSRTGHPITLYEYVETELKPSWFGHILSVPGKIAKFISKDEPPVNTINPSRLTPSQEGILNSIAGRINIIVDAKKGILHASALMQDPVVSTIVADSLVSKLGRYMVRYNTSKAVQDYEFISDQYERAKSGYYDAQKKYAAYVDRNNNVRQESVRIEMQRFNNEQLLAYELYANLAAQLEAAKIKVMKETPFVTVIEPARIPLKPASYGKLVMAAIFGFMGTAVAMAIVSFKYVASLEKQQ